MFKIYDEPVSPKEAAKRRCSTTSVSEVAKYFQSLRQQRLHFQARQYTQANEGGASRSAATLAGSSSERRTWARSFATWLPFGRPCISTMGNAAESRSKNQCEYCTLLQYPVMVPLYITPKWFTIMLIQQ